MLPPSMPQHIITGIDMRLLYLPLFDIDLQSSPIVSRDSYQHSCVASGPSWTLEGWGFDGDNDVITIPDHAALRPANGTIVIWMKTDEIDSNEVVLSKTVDASHRLAIWIQNNSVNAFLYGDAGNVLITNSNKITAGQWFCIIFTFGSGGAELFVDNVSIGTDADTTGMDGLTSGDLLLMQYGTDFCQGTVGEVIIFDSQLAEAERTTIYKNTMRTYKACWDFFTWG